MSYMLQPLLRIRLMREDRASGELVAAKRNLAQAEEALAARERDLADWEKTKDERRDRIYDAIIGREVSRDQIEAAAEAARANLNLAIKNRMKIDEHKAVWMADEAKAQEARAEGELEDFVVRKEEI